MQIIKDYSPGLVFCTFILFICYLIDNYLKSQNILLSLAFISLIFGITLNKFYLRHETLKKFTEFSLEKLLKLGIALLGISLSLNQLIMFGYISFFLIILKFGEVIFSTSITIKLSHLYDLNVAPGSIFNKKSDSPSKVP